MKEPTKIRQAYYFKSGFMNVEFFLLGDRFLSLEGLGTEDEKMTPTWPCLVYKLWWDENSLFDPGETTTTDIGWWLMHKRVELKWWNQHKPDDILKEIDGDDKKLKLYLTKGIK